MVVISDDFDHTKYSIFAFIQCIFGSLKAKFPAIKAINVFSDGPTSQVSFFKSTLLVTKTMNFPFFATSQAN